MGSGTHWDYGETSVLGHSVIHGILWCSVARKLWRLLTRRLLRKRVCSGVLRGWEQTWCAQGEALRLTRRPLNHSLQFGGFGGGWLLTCRPGDKEAS